MILDTTYSGMEIWRPVDMLSRQSMYTTPNDLTFSVRKQYADCKEPKSDGDMCRDMYISCAEDQIDNETKASSIVDTAVGANSKYKCEYCIARTEADGDIG